MKFATASALSWDSWNFGHVISADSLQELLGEPRLAIVDCRFDLMNPQAGGQAYLRAHIPGARYADLNRDLSAPIGPHTGRHPLPAPAAFIARLEAMGIGNDSQVVAYDDANGLYRGAALVDACAGSATAQRPCSTAVSRRGLPAAGALQSGEAELQVRHFRRAIAADAVLNTAAVERASRNPEALLVDARAPERYAGTAEPIDPVAGHVPGAVNHPFTANLDADSRFLPAAELKRRWQERLAGKEPENRSPCAAPASPPATICCASRSPDSPARKLYAGSWSEWIRDPLRPVARG